MKRFATALPITCFLTSAMITNYAGAYLITNGDMEANTLTSTGDNVVLSGIDNSWLANSSSGNVAWIGEDRSFTSSDDTAIDHFAFLNVFTDGTQVGQSIGTVADLNNTTIDITYDVTRRTNEGLDVSHIWHLIAGSSTTYVGGDVLGSTNESHTLGAAGDVDSLAASVSASGTTANTHVWLVFENDVSGGSQVMLDDVTAVPEPGSLALLGLGGLLIARRRRG